MQASELIEILEGLRPDEEVFFLPNNSSYPEDFSGFIRRNVNIRAFWGPDYKATIIFSDGQVGGWSDDDEDDED